jgi:hypothetical protein
MSFGPDNVILARLSGSFAPCPVSALAGHYDDEGVIYLRQRVVNVMQSGCRVVSQKREVFETSFMLRWEWYAFCTGLEVIHILSKCYPLPKPYTTDV